MKLSLYKKLFLVTALLLAFVVRGSSQTIYELAISEINGTYSTFAGTLIGSGDDTYWGYYLPFNFQYDNVVYTANTSLILISCNAFMQLYTDINQYNSYASSAAYSYTTAPGYTYHFNFMAWAQYDMYTNGSIQYLYTGVAPNRVFAVQWDNVGWYAYGGGPHGCQIRLYETSNKIEMQFGNVGAFPSSGYNASWSFLQGAYGTTRYINIKHGNPTSTFFQGNDVNRYFAATSPPTPGHQITWVGAPSYNDTWPTNGTVLMRGTVYHEPYTANQHPAGFFNRLASQQAVAVRYKIRGPLPASSPSYQTIYTATAVYDTTNTLHTFSSQPVGTNARALITYAKGLAANWIPSNDGGLDLYTNPNSIPAGYYAVTSTMELTTGYTQALSDRQFNIALNNDLAIMTINSPKSLILDGKRYPLTSPVAVECNVANIGVNPVTDFYVLAEIFVTNKRNGIEYRIYKDSLMYASPNPALGTGVFATMTFKDFHPDSSSDYRVQFSATLLSALDEDLSNNIAPIAIQGSYYFNVAEEVELQLKNDSSLVAPTGNIYVGRPVRPYIKAWNNGIVDASDVPAYMAIVRLSTGDTVWRSSSNYRITDIPSGRYNFSTTKLDADFVPPTAGRYRACMWIMSPDDRVTDNNFATGEFNVVDALAGDYTIGARFAGSANNFANIQAAMDALYQQGVTGAVTFYFTDASYDVGNKVAIGYPAWDMSSKIIGVSATNTITFKPYIDMSAGKSMVRINLLTESGVGILLGQNDSPAQSFAVVNGVSELTKRNYSNSDGYITFDGGTRSSLQFTLNTTNKYRAVFYLGNGTKNITVKNCVVTDGINQAVNYDCSLPLCWYNTSKNQFTFEPDQRQTIPTYTQYSAGIVMRNRVPANSKADGNNTRYLDTLPITNNLIQNNEISGFGYGIVDIGTGVLRYSDVSFTGFRRYYNKSNTIKGNNLFDIGRAGIFVGYEENSTVSNNRIYTIRGACGTEVAGIIAGGEQQPTKNGYNNIGLTIDGNEISDMAGTTTLIGIKVQQSLNKYPDPMLGLVPFPDLPDNLTISNNIVWGLNQTVGSANRAGIWLMTERVSNPDFLTMVVTPSEPKYFMTGCNLVNNTVWIQKDALAKTGSLAGIAFQQLKNSVIKNNAIAIDDDQINASSPVATAMFYNGQMPASLNVVCDRNVFWYGKTTGASLFRFVQTDSLSNIIEQGLRNEFNTLPQWQAWTGNDFNSTFGNFTGDLKFYNIFPKKLRINSDNNYPLGSLLNNRADKLTNIANDIDGNTRGAAGQRPDVGASEFVGRMYVSDIEMLVFSTPRAYQSTTGMFADAEYIMTTPPVEIGLELRNNGALQQSNAKINLKILKQDPAGTYSLIKSVDTTVTVASTENAVINFGLAKGLGSDFVPQSFNDLAPSYDAVVPVQFSTMKANISPIYRFQAICQSDQFKDNDTIRKDVRFYIVRSGLSTCISAENSYISLSTASTNDQIAGSLNHDTIKTAFNRLGWKIDLPNKRYDYDLLDRFGWEKRSVNYTFYRSLFWTDGDNKPLDIYQKNNMNAFLNSYVAGQDKKNLVIASQEMLNLNQTIDPGFTANILRAQYVSSPLTGGTSYEKNSVKGINIGKNESYLIDTTKFSYYPALDLKPIGSMMRVLNQGEGQAKPALYYINHTASPTDSIMGVVTSSISRNVVYFGMDWRHFGNLAMDQVFRATLDYIIKNGGRITPINLFEFDAVPQGKKVTLNWKTASEENSSKFEIERSLFVNGTSGLFEKISELAAAGKSNSLIEYGPVVDLNVDYGKTYSYRLKMIDKDGQSEYSNEVKVNINGINGNFGISEINPNPVETLAKFEITLTDDAQISLAIYDISGKLVQNLINGTKSKGSYPFEINTHNFVNGVYNIMLTSGDVVINRQFTVVK
ncbi:MAG: T9SS type A sorting domain-containing protein [Candidatus Kapabacteria bacterium]|nr:T9SS type A sorting domain-containing protein [Candidatus Kapabacteria bacterium]